MKQHFCLYILISEERHKSKQMLQELSQKQFSHSEFWMRNFWKSKLRWFQVKKKAWHSIIFFFKKLEFAELNYDIHDLKLLAIMWVFKHWKYYLKRNSHLIQMLTNHVNLQYFFMTKKLNQKQTCWAKKLVMFDFYIEYQTNKRNLTDRSFRCLNYRSVDDFHIKLLLML